MSAFSRAYSEVDVVVPGIKLRFKDLALEGGGSRHIFFILNGNCLF